MTWHSPWTGRKGWGHTEVALMEAICALTMLMLLLLPYSLDASHFTAHCAWCHFLSTGFSIQIAKCMVDKDDWWVGFDDADADKDDGDADKGNAVAEKTMLMLMLTKKMVLNADADNNDADKDNADADKDDGGGGGADGARCQGRSLEC